MKNSEKIFITTLSNIIKNIPFINKKSLAVDARLYSSSAEGGNRTPTSLSSTDFESVASTSSTTSALKERA